MAASGLHISIVAEEVFSIGGIAITNSMINSLLVSTVLITFAVIVRLKLQETDKPTGIQNLTEWLIEQFHNLVHSVTGDLQKTRLFLPVIATFFFFIVLNNWSGLVPGVGTISVKMPAEKDHASVIQSVTAAEPSETAEVLGDDVTERPAVYTEESLDDEHSDTGEYHADYKLVPIFRPGTADLNTTLALAIVSVLITQFVGLHALGLSYLKKFFNFSDPIMGFVGILELVSEFAKIVSFAFRLFGNIFAGEVLLVVISFLVPLVVPMPFYGLEVFVGFIQALVFAMLTLVFFKMATESHDNH